jgi:hypothetical protein
MHTDSTSFLRVWLGTEQRISIINRVLALTRVGLDGIATIAIIVMLCSRGMTVVSGGIGIVVGHDLCLADCLQRCSMRRVGDRSKNQTMRPDDWQNMNQNN